MTSYTLKRRATELILEFITNRHGKRSASLVNALQMTPQFIRYIFKKPIAFEELRLADALYYIDRLERCEASFDLFGYSF